MKILDERRKTPNGEKNEYFWEQMDNANLLKETAKSERVSTVDKNEKQNRDTVTTEPERRARLSVDLCNGKSVPVGTETVNQKAGQARENANKENIERSIDAGTHNDNVGDISDLVDISICSDAGKSDITSVASLSGSDDTLTNSKVHILIVLWAELLKKIKMTEDFREALVSYGALTQDQMDVIQVEHIQILI